MKAKLLFFSLVFAGLFLVSNRASAQDYRTAVGLRAAWGWGLSAKHFIKDGHALEGILRYRSYGSSVLGVSYKYSYLQISALYQIHKEIPSIDGLMWYFGGGAVVGFYSGDGFDAIKGADGGTTIGISGNVGLDYKFANIPLNISADWIPTFVLNGYGNGFGAEGGGVAVRYTF
ncbi:MAG TPA: hypothetical protein PK006_08885 [Saprospiraceae bacterium]|nr:hypothetical protein [Saprospiraceae bacterium]